MSYLPPYLEGVINLEWWAIGCRNYVQKGTYQWSSITPVCPGFSYISLSFPPSSLPANSSSLLISLRPSREQWESLHLLRLCSHSYSCASLALSMLFPLLIFPMFKTQMK